ncbi:hypothetical protein IWQ60_003833 [Tieghemiomyces parasiticus]|uniref:HSF-type DNA-binding domain-containing protein n=1 Tax=Tieghemiomyces parasiticus TaxID=78921 RepID=A0A9W8DZN9_9FUNG|nr:hypothetical protein IWQ60_003833 [Tieghemiomyces parasiticus]
MNPKSFSFVQKLYYTLEDPSYRHCVQWDCSGRFMVFTNVREYERLVLPRYHQTRAFKSLVRQLHLYGFRRGTDARKVRDNSLVNYCSFYHPQFVRGRPDLLPVIRRKPKSAKARESALLTVPQGSYCDLPTLASGTQSPSPSYSTSSDPGADLTTGMSLAGDFTWTHFLPVSDLPFASQPAPDYSSYAPIYPFLSTSEPLPSAPAPYPTILGEPTVGMFTPPGSVSPPVGTYNTAYFNSQVLSTQAPTGLPYMDFATGEGLTETNAGAYSL